MDLNIAIRRPRRSALVPSSPAPSGVSNGGGGGGEENQPPLTLEWLLGTWHVTHSTLPMWRWKMNVRITYSTTAPHRLGRGAVTMDDLVEYQEEAHDKVKQIRGVDTAVGNDVSMWKWRGRGLLFFTSSAWEILGHGTIEPSASAEEDTTLTGQQSEGEGGEAEGGGGGGGGGGYEAMPAVANQWVVTYFAKTWFTPAGIDIYSRHPAGLGSAAVASIKNALAQVDDAEIQALSQGLFAIL